MNGYYTRNPNLKRKLPYTITKVFDRILPLTRTVKEMDWEGITFHFSYGDYNSQKVRVPLERMEAFVAFEKELPSCKNPLEELAEWAERGRRWGYI